MPGAAQAPLQEPIRDFEKVLLAWVESGCVERAELRLHAVPLPGSETCIGAETPDSPTLESEEQLRHSASSLVDAALRNAVAALEAHNAELGALPEQGHGSLAYKEPKLEGLQTFSIRVSVLEGAADLTEESPMESKLEEQIRQVSSLFVNAALRKGLDCQEHAIAKATAAPDLQPSDHPDTQEKLAVPDIIY
jgi:hypothetical protein